MLVPTQSDGWAVPGLLPRHDPIIGGPRVARYLIYNLPSQLLNPSSTLQFHNCRLLFHSLPSVVTSCESILANTQLRLSPGESSEVAASRPQPTHECSGVSTMAIPWRLQWWCTSVMRFDSIWLLVSFYFYWLLVLILCVCEQ